MGVEVSSIETPKFDDLEVVISGQTSIPACSSSSTQDSPTITHNLGFVPIVIAWVSISGISGFNSQLPAVLYALGGTISPRLVCDINFLTTTTLNFYLSCNSSIQTNSPSPITYLICRRKNTSS